MHNILRLCYGIPPATHEAGCRISFGICIIPAERRTAGAPQWCHMPCCLFVKSLTPAVVPGELLLWPRPTGCGLAAALPQANCSALGPRIPAPASASTLAELSAKGPDSYSKPGADAFTEMEQCP